MKASWRFTDDEFYVQWRDLPEESLPSPLAYTCRTSSWVRYERELAELREDLRSRRDLAFDGVLASIRDADIRVEVWGWNGYDYRDPEGSIRMLAARRGSRGFLVAQQPGETVIHAKGFIVSEFDALDLGRVVAEALPEAPSGRLGDLVLAERTEETELDYSYGRSIIDHAVLSSAPAQSKAFLAAPHKLGGFIDVVQGQSVFGPRGITRHRLEWRDLEDDGRYFITEATPRQVYSVDTARATSLINARIADVVRAIKDERG
ncbi:ESX secretion-associated protein EspG [Nocardia sp. CDC160]|uniref:ESX secretion-associated protein EspG n=1 Tax=Nocardia sp. CDC160 TaxID=3112166 RepID=UPI002DBDA7FB|nr:ESX secretion-associated protein EspG [Nocardia sp. CDC160]MEC3913295.1 ESX secretion-associated protein EspG [Nocardia sp. CDC160]